MSWLLDALGDEDRRRVHAVMRRRRFARDEVLYHEGDAADSLHLIVKGRVAIRTLGPTGDSVTLNILGSGDVHGELALLGDEHRRSASVVALEAVETLVLQRDQFESLCERHPAVHRLLSAALAERVRELSMMVQDALFLSAEQRVVKQLTRLTEIYAADSARKVSIPVRQDVLASIAGTARPTANRVLQALQRDGLVSLARGRIVVEDRAQLQRRAH